MIKKLRLAVMILVTFMAANAGCIPALAEESGNTGLTKDVKILFTSDVHCAIDQGWGYGGVYAVKQGLSEDYHVLLVDDGDAVQGEPVGLMTKGEAIIDIMNATGYDIAIPGNHEFDYGMDAFLKLAEKAEFPYISCNFNKEGEPVFPAYVIREFDGVKIGFVGVTTPMTIRGSAPRYFMDENGNYIYGFFQDETGEGVYRAVQDAVDAARGEGADYVVVLGHMGNEAEVSPWMYSDVISHTSGIDAWLDGHSHDAEQVVMKNKDGQDVYRSACGTKNRNIGALTIAADGSLSTELYSWSSGISAPKLLGLSNPATEKVAQAAEILDSSMNAVLARTASDLVIYNPGSKMRDGKPVRLIQNTETNLGDLCADAYMNHFEEADIAFVNGSGIREDISRGDITMNDIMKTLPYGTKLVLAEVTGRQVLDALEWSVHSMPEEFGGFEHVAGLTYEVDPDLPTPCVEDEEKMFVSVDENMPRRVRNVKVGDADIDPDAVYKLATNVYILMDGDGFTMFRQAVTLKESDAADSEALLAYMTGPLGGVIGEEYSDPYGQGRMVSAGETSARDQDMADQAPSENDNPENDNTKTGGGIPWIDSELKENITADTPVDPKEDFHLYANKEWLLSNEIPDGYNKWSHYYERELDVQSQCLEILNDESAQGHDAELIYTYYRLLLDWDARNKSGVSELQETFDRILSAGSLEDITNLMTDAESSNCVDDFLIRVGAETGLNDPGRYLVGIELPKLLLEDSAEYSERTDLGDMYYGLRKEMFAFIAGKLGMSQEDADRTFDAAIELETKLSSKIYTTKETHRDDYLDRINNEMTYSELTSLSEVFPLDRILSASGYQYDGSYLVFSPDYIKLLDEIYTEENLEGMKALMLVDYVYEYRLVLDKETYDKFNELQRRYMGIRGTVPDEEMAYTQVVKALPASMQKVYISKYCTAEDKEKMEELCRTVIDTYREMLSDNSWVSDEVKKHAIEKLDLMTIHAAYPDKFRDTSGLDLSGCSLVAAFNRLGESELEYNRSLIGKETDKEMWAEGFDILSCNAFYSSEQNTINMLIGMMGEPFYSSDMSIEELYASIGAFWVGHEISHAFDSSGAMFDANGVYRDWWTNEDKEEFKKRVKKMDDYLDTIVAFGGRHFTGTNIDTEMIADMTGLQCALRMASKVPDFDYQKFFVKYAQMNGSLGLYSAELTQLSQDEHPLDYARTNVPVQQFDEFYEAYDVQEGDAMYLAPEDRLLIW